MISIFISQTRSKKTDLLPFLPLSSLLVSKPKKPRKVKEGTYGIQENGEEEFTSLDTFVQFLRTPRIFLVKNSVSEKATGLSRQHLWTKAQRRCDVNCFLQTYPGTAPESLQQLPETKLSAAVLWRVCLRAPLRLLHRCGEQAPSCRCGGFQMPALKSCHTHALSFHAGGFIQLIRS